MTIPNYSIRNPNFNEEEDQAFANAMYDLTSPDQGAAVNQALFGNSNTSSWLDSFIGDKDFSPLNLTLQGFNVLGNAVNGYLNYKQQKENLKWNKAQGRLNATNNFLANSGNLLNNVAGNIAFHGTNSDSVRNLVDNATSVLTPAANALANIGVSKDNYQAPLNQLDKYSQMLTMKV